MLSFRENIFLCLGSPLIDVISEVDEPFLKKYGLPINGAVVETEKHKNLFEELKNFHLQPGGSVTNTARVAQWILKYPRAVTYLGTMGRDNLGQILKSCLDKESVNSIFIENQEILTGKCAVLVHGQSRTLCTNLGASKYFGIENLQNPDIKRCLSGAKFIYLSVSSCIDKAKKYSDETF